MTRTPSSGTPGVTREFVGLSSPTARRAGSGGHPCQGLYHRGVGRKPKVAMIAVHYQIDFSEHYLADYMATRGIGFLGWNTRFRGFESSFMLDHALVDIGVGVRWLRHRRSIPMSYRWKECGLRQGSPTCQPPTGTWPAPHTPVVPMSSPHGWTHRS